MAADEGKEVLLVSDDEMIGKLLHVLLKSQGMLSRLENNMATGIERLKNRSCDTSLFIFDLNIISDEGLKALDAVRNFDNYSGLPPRIILSNCDVNCKDCGIHVSDNCFHFKKPFSTQQLMEKIKDIID